MQKRGRKKRGSKRQRIDVGKFGWEPTYLKQHRLIATTALVVCLFMSAGLMDRFVKESGSPYIAAVISAVLVDLANDDRALANVPELVVNPKLIEAAQLKANDMAEKGYFAHQTPDGYDSWHWFEMVGYDYSHAGENLAVDFSESSDVESAWMKSPTHRDNILNNKYTEIGIATAKGMYKGRETTFAVQMFGRPSGTEVAKASGEVAVVDRAEITKTISIDSQILGETDTGDDPIVVGAAAEQDGDAMIVSQEDIPWWGRMIAQPKEMLRYAYLIIGLLLLAALFGDMEWEIHKHHYRHAMKVGGVLATMSMLFIVADWVFFAEPVLAAIGTLL